MPEFDKNTGYKMTMSAHSKNNTDGVFAKRDMDLMKAAPAFNKGKVKGEVKGVGMVGDSDKDRISTERLDNIIMYGKDKSKKRYSPDGKLIYSPGD